ncbi:MAG: hypothetical protein WAN36_13560, partial [Calditrichia bacterium]
LFRQLTQQEWESFEEKLPVKAPEKALLDLLRQEDFYRILDLLKNKYSTLPAPLFLYNWLQLINNLLHHLSQDKTVLMVIRADDTFLDEYSDLLKSLLQTSSTLPVKWLFLGSEKKPDFNAGDFFSGGNLIPGALFLNQFFSTQESCSFTRSCAYLESAERVYLNKNRKPAETADPGILAGLSEKELSFLQYFAVSGFFNPLKFVNYLLNQHFNADGSLLISLIRRNILVQEKGPAECLNFYFREETLYRAVLSSCATEQRKELRQEVLSFWDAESGVADRERLLRLLWENGSPAKFAFIGSDLLQFYSLTYDFSRYKTLLPRLEEVAEKEKQKTGGRLRIAIQKSFAEPASEPVSATDIRFLQTAFKASLKYQKEQWQIAFIYLIRAVLHHNIEAVELIREWVNSKGDEHEMSPIVNLLIGTHDWRERKFNSAQRKSEQYTMQFYTRDQYWYIPLGCLQMSLVFESKKDFENAYTYATMALQAADALNDFWTMDYSLKRIEQNPHYRQNIARLKDWAFQYRNRLQLFRTADLGKFDLREKIFRMPEPATGQPALNMESH